MKLLVSLILFFASLLFMETSSAKDAWVYSYKCSKVCESGKDCCLPSNNSDIQRTVKELNKAPFNCNIDESKDVSKVTNGYSIKSTRCKLHKFGEQNPKCPEGTKSEIGAIAYEVCVSTAKPKSKAPIAKKGDYMNYPCGIQCDGGAKECCPDNLALMTKVVQKMNTMGCQAKIKDKSRSDYIVLESSSCTLKSSRLGKYPCEPNENPRLLRDPGLRRFKVCVKAEDATSGSSPGSKTIR